MKDNRLKIVIETLQYMWGEVLIMISGLVSFPIFTRIFSREQYGLFSLIGATFALLMGISALGMNRSIVRLYDKYKLLGKHQEFISTLFIVIICFGTFFIGTVILFCRVFLENWIVVKFAFVPFVLALVWMLMQNLFILLNTTFRMEHKSVLYNINGIIRKYGAMVLVVSLVLYLHTLTAFYTGMVAFDFIILIILLIQIKKKLGFHFDRNELFLLPLFKDAFTYGAPLAFTSLPLVILNSGDRYVINAFWGPAEVANYGVAYNLCMYVKEIIISPLNLALLPTVFKLWESGKREEVATILTLVVRCVLMLAIPICFMSILISEDLIILLASEKYAMSAKLIPFILAGVFFQTLDFPLSAGLHLEKQTSKLVWLTLIATVLNISLNIIIVPHYGIMGAAYVTIISYAGYSALLFLSSQSKLSFQLPYVKVSLYLILSIIAFICAGYYKKFTITNYGIVNIVNITIFFGAIYLFLLYLTDSDTKRTIKAVRWKI